MSISAPAAAPRTRTVQFGDHAITFTRAENDEWYARLFEINRPLGYKLVKSVYNLYDRNRHRFLDRETHFARVRKEISHSDGKKSSSGTKPVPLLPGFDGDETDSFHRTYRTIVFSPHGVLRLCMLGRNRVSDEFHNWLLYRVIPDFYRPAPNPKLPAIIEKLLRRLGPASLLVQVASSEIELLGLDLQILQKKVVQEGLSIDEALPKLALLGTRPSPPDPVGAILRHHLPAPPKPTKPKAPRTATKIAAILKRLDQIELRLAHVDPAPA